jgi:hypothetical protein
VVNDNKDRSKTVRRQKVFNEFHGYGVPRAGWNQKLFEQSIRLVARRLCVLAHGTVILDKRSHAGPYILSSDQFQCLVLAKVS